MRLILILIMTTISRKKKEVIEDLGDLDKLEALLEEKEIDLEKLTTNDTDPKVVIENLLSRYFPDKSSTISRVSFRDILCQKYHQISYE